jgi:hypothetical protein
MIFLSLSNHANQENQRSFSILGGFGVSSVERCAVTHNVLTDSNNYEPKDTLFTNFGIICKLLTKL